MSIQLPPLSLIQSGFEVVELRHAGAILNTDYPFVVSELADCLQDLEIEPIQVIEGGGGKSSITKSMEDRFKVNGWLKKNFDIELTVDGARHQSQTHEIDHFREIPGCPGVALEIEWNNKDPFYDRDLETFSRLHAIGVISVGVMVTRGPGLQAHLRDVFRRHYGGLNDDDLDSVLIERGTKLQQEIRALPEDAQRRSLADKLFQSKFGQATTHWDKLQARIDRGLGNPCPLLLIGITREQFLI